MKRILTVVLVVGLFSISATESHARKEYMEQFQKRYVGDKSTEGQQKLAATLEKLTENKYNCFICHDPKRNDGTRSKRNCNDYGKLLVASGMTKEKTYLKFSEKKDEAIVKAKTELMDKALEAAEKKPLPGADQTILQSLQAGKLPITYTEAELE